MFIFVFFSLLNIHERFNLNVQFYPPPKFQLETSNIVKFSNI